MSHIYNRYVEPSTNTTMSHIYKSLWVFSLEAQHRSEQPVFIFPARPSHRPFAAALL
jgi:hypothetical protein